MSASKQIRWATSEKSEEGTKSKVVSDTYQSVNGKAEKIHGHRIHSNSKLETSCHHSEATGSVELGKKVGCGDEICLRSQ